MCAARKATNAMESQTLKGQSGQGGPESPVGPFQCTWLGQAAMARRASRDMPAGGFGEARGSSSGGQRSSQADDRRCGDPEVSGLGERAPGKDNRAHHVAPARRQAVTCAVDRLVGFGCDNCCRHMTDPSPAAPVQLEEVLRQIDTDDGLGTIGRPLRQPVPRRCGSGISRCHQGERRPANSACRAGSREDLPGSVVVRTD